MDPTQKDLHDLAAANSTYRGRPPKYAEIISGSKAIRFFAGLNFLVAAVMAGFGVYVIINDFCNPSHAPPDDPRYAMPNYSLSVGWAAVVCGALWSIFGFLLNMVAELALAIRGVARNSFMR